MKPTPYYDLHITCEDSENKLKFAEKLGWNGICLVEDFNNPDKFMDFSEEVYWLRQNSKLDTLIGALIHPESQRRLKEVSRSALEYVDIILVDGGDTEINRMASECWEVDILAHPERNRQKDFMRQRNSGINDVIAKLMAEKCVAIEFNFSEILNSGGMFRSRVMGRMQQNVRLARKYNVPMILTSGAIDRYGMRSPRDLMAIGKTLGMTDKEAKSSVSTDAMRIVQKSRDRKNPDILMKGLQVVEWGEQEKRKKRMYGWY